MPNVVLSFHAAANLVTLACKHAALPVTHDLFLSQVHQHVYGAIPHAREQMAQLAAMPSPNPLDFLELAVDPIDHKIVLAVDDPSDRDEMLRGLRRLRNDLVVPSRVRYTLGRARKMWVEASLTIFDAYVALGGQPDWRVLDENGSIVRRGLARPGHSAGAPVFFDPTR
jgi:hypothetical protein